MQIANAMGKLNTYYQYNEKGTCHKRKKISNNMFIHNSPLENGTSQS